MTPTYAVIASKDRPEMLRTLVGQLLPQVDAVFPYNNGYRKAPVKGMTFAHGWSLHRMWNSGIYWAEEGARNGGHGKWNVLVINDDVEVAPDLVAMLGRGLRSEAGNWIAYPDTYNLAEQGVRPGQALQLKNLEMAHQTMAGWCFMLRGEKGYRLDEQFAWWYGDSDIEKQVRRDGGHVVCVAGAKANHLDPLRSTFATPGRLAQAQADEERFAAKWGIDPATLYLSQMVARA